MNCHRRGPKSPEIYNTIVKWENKSVPETFKEARNCMTTEPSPKSLRTTKRSLNFSVPGTEIAPGQLVPTSGMSSTGGIYHVHSLARKKNAVPRGNRGLKKKSSTERRG